MKTYMSPKKLLVRLLSCSLVSLATLWGTLAAAANSTPPPPPAVYVANTSSQRVPVAVNSPVSITTQSPIPTDAQSIVEYRWVGVTDNLVAGDLGNTQPFGRGVSAMNALCVDKFGRSARAANTTEIQDRSALHETPSNSAWVIPTLPVTVVDDGNGHYEAVDATGATMSPYLPNAMAAMNFAFCLHYHSDAVNAYGPVASTANGDVLPQTCETTHAVACSAPVIVPAQALGP